MYIPVHIPMIACVNGRFRDTTPTDTGTYSRTSHCELNPQTLRVGSGYRMFRMPRNWKLAWREPHARASSAEVQATAWYGRVLPMRAFYLPFTRVYFAAAGCGCGCGLGFAAAVAASASAIASATSRAFLSPCSCRRAGPCSCRRAYHHAGRRAYHHAGRRAYHHAGSRAIHHARARREDHPGGAPRDGLLLRFYSAPWHHLSPSLPHASSLCGSHCLPSPDDPAAAHRLSPRPWLASGVK